MIKTFALLTCVSFLTGCVTTQNMKPSEPLLENEGIVVTTCKTPNAINRVVSVIPADYKHTFGDIPPHVSCSQEGKLAVIKLEAGDYHTGETKNFNVYKHLPSFTVQPNKINYIGDLRIAVSETNLMVGLLVGFQQPKISFSVVDERQETLQQLRDERPDIADNYKMVVDIAK